jgi:hypothetical protein
VSQVFRTIHVGDVLEVYWRDPDTPADLFRVLPEVSYDLLIMEELETDEPSYRMEIQKKSAQIKTITFSQNH